MKITSHDFRITSFILKLFSDCRGVSVAVLHMRGDWRNPNVLLGGLARSVYVGGWHWRLEDLSPIPR